MKNSVGKGALILIASGFVCKFFGALFRLPLTNILGIEGIGVFQMIMSLYSLSLVFVSTGVQNGLSKLISSARACGDKDKLGAYLRQALFFSMSLSLAIGLIFAVLSKQIASLQGSINGAISYMLMLVLLPLGALIGVYRGIIQGYENMSPTAISQIIEQIAKFSFGLLFAYLLSRFGDSKGVFGAFLGITVSELLALVYLAFVMLKKVRLNLTRVNVKKDFYSTVMPLSLGNAIIPLTHAIEALIVVALLTQAGLSNEVATSLYGLQTGVVGAILNFPMVIALSVAMALLPKLSYLSTRKDLDGQKIVINNSFNVMWFFLVPLVIGIVALSRVIYPIIYPNAIKGYLDVAVQLTMLGGISIVLSAIMQLLISILQAQGFFIYSMYFNIVGGGLKVLAIILLAPIKAIGIFALPISNIILYSIVSVCALIKLGSLVKVNFFEFLLPILSSAVMFIVVKFMLDLLPNILGVCLSIVAGVIVYFLMAFPLTKSYCEMLILRLKNKKE